MSIITLNHPRWDGDPIGALVDATVSEYELHEGLLVIPVMGPAGTPPVIVRTHAPYTTRHAEFQMARNKFPPLVPSPGDTLSGDIYLGGSLSVKAPTQDGEGYLVFAVKGGWNFVSPVDLREHGKIHFDAHAYRSNVDFLGHYNTNPKAAHPKDFGDVWQSPYFDLNLLASNRILG